MTKEELVAKMAEKSGLSKAESKEALKALLESVKETLASGEEISLIGFGTFKVSERSERQGKNPKTGEVITIKASKCPSFKAGKSLKDAVNN